MKKTCICIFAMLFSLCAVSCMHISNPNRCDDTNDDTDTTVIVDYAGWDITDYKTYQETILNNMPPDFVTYEKISELGDFGGFYGDSSDYSYWLGYDGSKGYTLYFSHLRDDAWNVDESILILDCPNNDLRYYTPNDGRSHMFVDDELLYEYTGDKLRSICWYREELLITFWNNNETFAEFPDDGSLVSRLLNKNTALEAKAEFEAMVFGEE